MEGFWEATLDGELTERKVSEPKHKHFCCGTPLPSGGWFRSP